MPSSEVMVDVEGRVLADAEPLHLRHVDAEQRAEARALVARAAERLHEVGREVGDLDVADELAVLVEHRLLHLDEQARQLDARARQILGAQGVARVGGGFEIDARVEGEVADDGAEHRQRHGDDDQRDARLAALAYDHRPLQSPPRGARHINDARHRPNPGATGGGLKPVACGLPFGGGGPPGCRRLSRALLRQRRRLADAGHRQVLRLVVERLRHRDAHLGLERHLLAALVAHRQRDADLRRQAIGLPVERGGHPLVAPDSCRAVPVVELELDDVVADDVRFAGLLVELEVLTAAASRAASGWSCASRRDRARA